MKTLRITLFTAALALFFTGCVGPEGQQGPPGPQGINGSYVVGTSSPADWQPSGSFLIASYTTSAISSNAVANGVIMVYFQTSSMGSTQWAPLPDTYPLSSTVEQTFTFNYDVNTITLQMQNSDGSIPNAPAAFNFKVVVIPTAVLKQHPGLNVKDYSMVSQLLNIKA
ncbi:MAG TPA: hypothetical protein VN922_17780 [Bacteroidia bacterium]|nr:hypothetical protein [Bacteroidia bacterium]